MAIYHLSVRTVSRAQGKKGALKRDYVTREGRYKKDESEVLYKESGNLPSWASTDKAFWKAADSFERRNARIGMEIEFALPKELNDEAKITLAKRLRSEVVKQNFPYTMAIHKGQKRQENPHAHLVFSARKLDEFERSKEQFFRRANKRFPERGGALKDRDIKKKTWLRELRETWSELANDQLKIEGQSVRIDHRTLKEQGIERIAGRHIGSDALRMEQRGIKTERGANFVEARLAEKQRSNLQKSLGEVRRDIQRLERKKLNEIE